MRRRLTVAMALPVALSLQKLVGFVGCRDMVDQLNPFETNKPKAPSSPRNVRSVFDLVVPQNGSFLESC